MFGGFVLKIKKNFRFESNSRWVHSVGGFYKIHQTCESSAKHHCGFYRICRQLNGLVFGLRWRFSFLHYKIRTVENEQCFCGIIRKMYSLVNLMNSRSSVSHCRISARVVVVFGEYTLWTVHKISHTPLFPKRRFCDS